VFKNEIFDFINFKKSQEYSYSAGSKEIKYFDRFLQVTNYKNPILTAELIDQYICCLSKYGARTKQNRFSVVKEFSAYLKIFKPQSHLIVKNIFRKPVRKRAYIFKDMEISMLLNAAKTYESKHPLYSITNYTIIGLLVTGTAKNRFCLLKKENSVKIV
jgi:hypothetical protein